MKKTRLDDALVERNLIETRDKARAIILAREVKVNGVPCWEAGHPVLPEDIITIEPRRRWASRGGDKIEPILDAFGIDPSGEVWLDAGSSTGGFTDLLLARGASRVHAVDVGRGLLDMRLRNDPRVVPHEGVNLRLMEPGEIGEKVDGATLDLSFISLKYVEGAVRGVLKPDGRIVALVKPQFEVERERVGKGGIVRDPSAIEGVMDDLGAFFENRGYRVEGRAPSPASGGKRNTEHFLLLMRERL